MTDGTHEDEPNTAVANPVDAIVRMPYYVAPEHRDIVEGAEKALFEYERFLISRIERELKKYPSIQCHQAEIQRAEKAFHEDPMRQLLFKKLCEIKLVCEKPRFMTKAI